MHTGVLKFMPFAGVIILWVVSINVSCNREPTARFGEDIKRLGELIHLPIVPSQAWFGTVPRGVQSWAPGPTDWIFVAVMRFDAATLKSFLTNTKLDERAPATISRSLVATWFPREVTSTFTPLNEKEYKVRGRKFMATPFSAKPSTQSDWGNAGTFLVLEGLPFVVLQREL